MQVPREFESLNLRPNVKPWIPGVFFLKNNMEYILYAFLALLASAGNTIFNRLGANRASALTNATVKSFFIVITCFFFCLIQGNLPVLYDLRGEDWIWIAVVGVFTAANWFLYFLAIKRTHLETFTNFNAAGFLFLSNLLFLIFTFGAVTNGGKPLNIALYVIGLVSVLIAIVYIVTNKKLNPNMKTMWLVYAAFSCVFYAVLVLIVKLKLSHLPTDVISFHQMMVCFCLMLIASLVSKNIKQIVHIHWRDLIYIFLGAIFNALLTIFRYSALTEPNSIPAIVNVIIGLDFIIVSFATVFFFKAKNKVQLSIAVSLVFVGMILNLLAGLI